MKTHLLPLTLIGMSAISASAVTIVNQGFETSGDTWNFTLDPNATFDGGGDTWAATTGMAGFSAITGPQQGTQYWGGRDMDGNAAFTSSTRGWLVFEDIDVSGYESKTLTFYWSGQSAVEEIGYLVATTTDGNSASITPNLDILTPVSGGVTLAANEAGTFLQDWTEVTINIADNVTNVSFALYGLSDGGTRYLAFDDVVLAGTVIPEPSTVALGVAGLVGAVALMRRQKRS
ncbi:PEP-CTERM sorting domain-containing protein [Cerasicoccus fimbriatus]|uniref:PEP-CTERM sorting domain-containing protein n=1 Tax=Cerasicoccus fimbriatus TaxID=3014554 RepID=UPI0022B5A75A|nr:PEP-CTERM sorting domain-containing protein [Cerasicoccus sp. TK19100]